MVKISVIIPVYNVGKYLRKCLESICSQTLADLEIIPVYDPSPDNSLEILKEWADKDSRIKIIVKDKKEGLSIAKNRGMEAAVGEYITFVDGDDYIEPAMYEKLYNKAKQLDAEIAFCTIGTVNEKTGKLNEDKHYCDSPLDKKYDDKAFSWREIKEHLCFMPVSSWNKIYKREFIEKNRIIFPENMTFEENPFYFKAMILASRLALVRERLYHYHLQRTGSLLNTRGVKFIDNIEVMEKTADILKELNAFDELKEFYTAYRLGHVIHFFNIIRPEFKAKYYAQMHESLKKIELEAYRNSPVFDPELYKKALKLIKYPSYFLYQLTNPLSIRKYPDRLELRFLDRAINIPCVLFDRYRNISTAEEIEAYLNRINFQQKIDMLAKKYGDKRVVIYGGGLLFSVIARNYDLSGFNIIAVADKKVKEGSDLIEGYPGLEFKGLKELTEEYVLLIAVLRSKSIIDMLKYGIYSSHKKPPVIAGFV